MAEFDPMESHVSRDAGLLERLHQNKRMPPPNRIPHHTQAASTAMRMPQRSRVMTVLLLLYFVSS